MIGIGLHIGNRVMGGGGAAFDVDAQAFFDRVTVAGGTLTTTEKNATNQLVLDMKSAGIWTSMKAVYPMVGSSSAACAQNLVSSSFTGTFNGGWTFASTGVTGNGINNYMQTNLNMLTQLPTDANIGVYSRTNHIPTTSGYPIIWGAVVSPIFLYLGGDQYKDSYLGTTATNIANQSGYLGFFQRSGSTGVQNRRLNAIDKGTNSQNYTAANDTLKLGWTSTDTTNSEIAFFSIGNYITTTQQDTFYTAVQAFQTTLSRQV